MKCTCGPIPKLQGKDTEFCWRIETVDCKGCRTIINSDLINVFFFSKYKIMVGLPERKLLLEKSV